MQTNKNAPTESQGAKVNYQTQYNTNDGQKLTIDLPEAERFLTLLDEEAEAFTFQTFADSPKAQAEEKEREAKGLPKTYAHTFNGTLEQHAAKLERYNRMGAGVFVTINRTDLKGRKADNVKAVRAVFADTDGAPLEPISNCSIEPHIIVESSEGKWHPYWLTDGLALTGFQGVQRRIADKFGTDASVTDLSRVLRLPGFYHRKADPFMVRIIHESRTLPYTADKILETFPPLLKEGTSRHTRQAEIADGDEILKALIGEGCYRGKRPDGGYNIACPFEAEHTSGTNQTETTYFPANTGGFKTPSFVCMHDHCADRILSDYVEELGLSSGGAPMTYDEVLAAASAMDQDTVPADIEKLAEKTAVMGTVEREKILKRMKATTGINVGDLRGLVTTEKRKKKKQVLETRHSNYAPMFQEQFPDIVFNEETGASKVPATIANVEAMLKNYQVSASYDVISKKTYVIVPGMTGSPDNADNSALTRLISLAKLNDMQSEMVPAYVEAIADERQVNPVADWINGCEWDGVDRLPAMCRSLEVAGDYPEELRDVLVRRWLVSAVAAALKPIGFRARGVLTLQGPQSIGKTAWLQSLVPDLQLRERLVKTDHMLDPNNKDSILGAITHWLVELGELDSSFKKDIARMKGFITADKDKVRRPYARLEAEYQRRTVFFASVNNSQFLVDETGNTRFWTIAVKRINYNHLIDMQQVWAQMAYLFEVGEQWWLTPEEEAHVEHVNKGHRAASSVRELIMAKLNFSALPAAHTKMSATEVLVRIGFDKPNNAQSREAGAVLRELFGEPAMSNGLGRWNVPPMGCMGDSGFEPAEEWQTG